MASNVLSLSITAKNNSSTWVTKTMAVNASRFRQFMAGTEANTTEIQYNRIFGFSDTMIAASSYSAIKTALSADFVIRDFEVSVLTKNGFAFAETVSLNTADIVYAQADPTAPDDQTLLYIENNSKQGGVDSYILDMTLAAFVTLVNT